MAFVFNNRIQLVQRPFPPPGGGGWEGVRFIDPDGCAYQGYGSLADRFYRMYYMDPNGHEGHLGKVNDLSIRYTQDEIMEMAQLKDWAMSAGDIGLIGANEMACWFDQLQEMLRLNAEINSNATAICEPSPSHDQSSESTESTDIDEGAEDFAIQLINASTTGLSFGVGTGQGGDKDTQGWITKTGRGVGAYMPANTTKEVLIDYARTTGNIGETGAKYLKVVKGTGVAGSLVCIGVSGYNIYHDYSKNGNGFKDVNGWDVADAGIGTAGLAVTGLVTLGLVSNPIGWGVTIVTGAYFLGRLIYDVATDD